MLRGEPQHLGAARRHLPRERQRPRAAPLRAPGCGPARGSIPRRREARHVELEARDRREALVEGHEAPGLGAHEARLLELGGGLVEAALTREDARSCCEADEQQSRRVDCLAIALDLGVRRAEVTALHPEQRRQRERRDAGQLVSVPLRDFPQLLDAAFYALEVAAREAPLAVHVEREDRLPELAEPNPLFDQRIVDRMIRGPVAFQEVVDEVHEGVVETQLSHVSSGDALVREHEYAAPEREGDAAEGEDPVRAGEHRAGARHARWVEAQQHAQCGHGVEHEGRREGLGKPAPEADLDDLALALAGRMQAFQGARQSRGEAPRAGGRTRSEARASRRRSHRCGRRARRARGRNAPPLR